MAGHRTQEKSDLVTLRENFDQKKNLETDQHMGKKKHEERKITHRDEDRLKNKYQTQR